MNSVVLAADRDDPEAHPGGGVIGLALRVVLVTMADGRPKVITSFTEFLQGVRASGKHYRSWRTVKRVTVFRTQKGLVVERTTGGRTHRSAGRAHRSVSRHLFDSHDVTSNTSAIAWQYVSSVRDMNRDGGAEETCGDTGILALEPHEHAAFCSRIENAVSEHMGRLPNRGERYPLLPSDAEGLDSFLTAPFLDAPDYARVAKNAFGVRAYRKPLAGLVQGMDLCLLHWFSLFRGLVPIDWIIDSMRIPVPAAQFSRLAYADSRTVRGILRCTPQPVLRRLLKGGLGQHVWIPLVDAAREIRTHNRVYRDIASLPALMSARAQRDIRNATDIESIVRSIPELDDPAWSSRHDRRGSATARVLASEKVMLSALKRAQETATLLLADDSVTGNDRALSERLARVTWDEWKSDETLREHVETLSQNQRRAIRTQREQERQARIERKRQERLAREAERHAWALATMDNLDGVPIAGRYTITVARTRDDLARWKQQMSNCINNYGHLIGLDVFIAVHDDSGVMRLNANIVNGEVHQILGKHNRDVARELGAADGQRVIDELAALGVQFTQCPMGVNGLAIPADPAAA